MADHGITCSMSRSGNAWDNVAMEGFCASVNFGAFIALRSIPSQEKWHGKL